MGRDPQTGALGRAVGIIAVGRFAFGVIALGQVAVGVLPIGQISLGLLLALGQVSVSGYEAFRTLQDIVPRPDYVATGEERAWGRRLAKRFGIDADSYDEFDCACLADDCRGKVTGYDWMIPEVQQRYRGHFSTYLERRIAGLASDEPSESLL